MESSSVVYVRERPLGMIPFVLGVSLFVGACVACWTGLREAWLIGGLLAFGATLTAVGVSLFRRPHRLELAAEEVRIAGRFGEAHAWPHARLKEPPMAGLVALEALFFASIVPVVVVMKDHPVAPGVFQVFALGVAYAHAWRQWRLAPRLIVQDSRGSRRVVRLDGVPRAAEAIAARAPRPAALVA